MEILGSSDIASVSSFVFSFACYYLYLSILSLAAIGSKTGNLAGICVQSDYSSLNDLNTSSIFSNFLFWRMLRWEKVHLHSAHLAIFSQVFSLTTWVLTQRRQKTCIHGSHTGSCRIFRQIGHRNSPDIFSYCFVDIWMVVWDSGSRICDSGC